MASIEHNIQQFSSLIEAYVVYDEANSNTVAERRKRIEKLTIIKDLAVTIIKQQDARIDRLQIKTKALIETGRSEQIDLNDARTKLKDAMVINVELQASLDGTLAAINSGNASLERISDDLLKLQEDLEERNNHIAELQSFNASLEQELHETKGKLARSVEQISAERKRGDAYKRSAQAYDSHIDSLESEYADLTSAYDEKHQELLLLKKQLKELQQENEKYEKLHEKLKTSKSSLRNLLQHPDDFVKELINHIDKIHALSQNYAKLYTYLKDDIKLAKLKGDTASAQRYESHINDMKLNKYILDKLLQIAFKVRAKLADSNTTGEFAFNVKRTHPQILKSQHMLNGDLDTPIYSMYDDVEDVADDINDEPPRSRARSSTRGRSRSTSRTRSRTRRTAPVDDDDDEPSGKGRSKPKRKSTAWNILVKGIFHDNPGIPFKDAMIYAKSIYNKPN